MAKLPPVTVRHSSPAEAAMMMGKPVPISTKPTPSGVVAMNTPKVGVRPPRIKRPMSVKPKMGI